jgi:hypothetical protein
MQWIAVIFILSLGVGLRRRIGLGACAFLVVGVGAVTTLWYLQLGRSL